MKKYLYMLFICLYSPLVYAQEIGIAAVVNNDIISSADLENRVRLIDLSQQAAGEGTMDKSLRPKVLEMLIGERLYRQEAARLKFSVSDEEVANATRMVEERNHMQPGGMEKLLTSANLPYSTFKDQLEAQLLWNKVANTQIRPKIKISNAEVIQAKKHMPIPEKTKFREVLISEIALPVLAKEQEAEIKNLANRLLKEIRGGKAFGLVAAQNSKSPSAQNGGKVGWVIEQAIPPELAKVVNNLQDGQVSEVVRTERGYYLIKAEARRNALSKEQYAAKVNIKQVFIPIAQDATTALVKQEQEKLQSLANDIKTCKDFDTVIIRAMPSEPITALNVTIKDTQPDLQNILLRQAVNNGSSVVRSSSGLHLVVICSRDNIPAPAEEKPVILDENTVRDMLMQKKIDDQARRYLQNLRRKAEIEIR